MSEERELTRTEALLVNLLDNPDDDLARYAFADYVTEYDAGNAPALAKAKLITALKTLHEHADRGGCEAAYEQLNDALTDPRLDLGLGPGRRAEIQVRALQALPLRLGLGPRACCGTFNQNRSPVCRCLAATVSCDLRLGFIDTLRLSTFDLRTTSVPAGELPMLASAFEHNPLKRFVVEDAAMVVEIDRWRDGEANGWQAYFYDRGPEGRRVGDYFRMESFEFRQEVTDNLNGLVLSVVHSRAFGGETGRPLMTSRQVAEATRPYTGTETGRASSTARPRQNLPRRRRGQT